MASLSRRTFYLKLKETWLYERDSDAPSVQVVQIDDMRQLCVLFWGKLSLTLRVVNQTCQLHFIPLAPEGFVRCYASGFRKHSSNGRYGGWRNCFRGGYHLVPAEAVDVLHRHGLLECSFVLCNVAFLKWQLSYLWRFVEVSQFATWIFPFSYQLDDFHSQGHITQKA